MIDGADTIRRRLGKAFNEEDHPRDAQGRWSSGGHAGDNAANFPGQDAKRADAIDKRLDGHFAGMHAARQQISGHIKSLKDAHKALSTHHKGAERALSDLNDLYEQHGFDPIGEDDVDEIADAGSLRSSLAQLFEDAGPYLTLKSSGGPETSGADGTHDDPIAALDAALQASLTSSSS